MHTLESGICTARTLWRVVYALHGGDRPWLSQCPARLSVTTEHLSPHPCTLFTTCGLIPLPDHLLHSCCVHGQAISQDLFRRQMILLLAHTCLSRDRCAAPRPVRLLYGCYRSRDPGCGSVIFIRSRVVFHSSIHVSRAASRCTMGARDRRDHHAVRVL